MNETRPAHGGAENPTPGGHDYEYDEAHDAPGGPRTESPAPHPVRAPESVRLDGDYGYDEAHDFGS